MLWMKGQRKYPSLPSQQDVAGKSHIAEGGGGKQKNNLFFSAPGSMPIPENPTHFPALRFPYHTCTQRSRQPPPPPPPPQHYFPTFPFFPATTPVAVGPKDAKSNHKQKHLYLTAVTDS